MAVQFLPFRRIYVNFPSFQWVRAGVFVLISFIAIILRAVVLMLISFPAVDCMQAFLC